MTISTIGGRVLQSLEFMRFNVGGWWRMFWRANIIAKVFVLCLFIWSCIRFTISLFGQLCSAIADCFAGVHATGIQGGGIGQIVAFANTVLPLDEIIALFISWFVLETICTEIAFIRAAWAAVPLKAT